MSGETISSLPQAVGINGLTDFTVVSQATGNPSAPYVSRKATALLLAGLSPIATATAIEFIVKGSPGHVLGTGLAGYLVAPYGGVINGYAMLADASGSIAVDIWRCSYAQFDAGVTHPVLADSICGGNLPAIVSDVKVQGAATGWITAFSPNDVLAYNVYSTSGTISQLTLSLNVTKTTVP